MPVMIRRNFGSFPVVDRVLAYDAAARVASVLYKAHHGQLPYLDTVGIDELEASDDAGELFTAEGVKWAVRRVARMTVNEEAAR